MVCAVPGVAVKDNQGACRRFDSDSLVVAAFADRGFAGDRVAAPLVTARHEYRASIVLVEIGQRVYALAQQGLRRQR